MDSLIALFRNVFFKCLTILHGGLPGGGDNHCLGLATQFLHDGGAEMLYNDLDPLRDISIMQLHKAGDLSLGFVGLTAGIILNVLIDLVEGRVFGVILQYISRTNCTWDEEFQVFTLTSDVEETSTRSEDISLDYDFFHSDLLEISCGGNYTAKVIPKDINIWISRLFLGDADGFSILYYQDVDSLVYWANQAAYRWKLRGMCMWSLGQEDMRLWEWLPKQI